MLVRDASYYKFCIRLGFIRESNFATLLSEDAHVEGNIIVEQKSEKEFRP